MPSASPAKSEHVISGLRERIVAGELVPGERLPTWTQLQQDFGVTRPTLTKAMDRLKGDGLIYSDSTRGTFVTAHPPHLHRYAVAFGQRPGSPGWNRFWDAICREVQRRDADDEPEGPDAARKFPVFFGVTGEPHNKPYRDLRRQVRSGRVAGLIVVGTTDFQMMQMPELIDGRLPLPRVTIFAKPVADVPTVTIDHDSFIRRSLDAVQQAGSRTVAVLTADNDSFCGYAKAITSRGLKTKPYWHFEASAKGARGVQNLVHLLLDRPPKDRPDALIITDDNLVEAALAGVVASRTVVPDDLCIVTHCNWPEPVTRVLPVTRLGFDVRQVLDRCIDCLDRQREGTTCDPITRVPPLTEREACSTRDRFRSSQTLLEVPR